MANLLEVNNLYKSYGSLDVLCGVNLVLPEHSTTAIMGKSGAGKSTLLHILGALDSPDSGNIIYNGVNISKYSKKQLADFRNRKVGFVFQHHHLLPEFSALENVSIPGWIQKRPDAEVKADAEALLDFMGLTDRASHRPSELSGGEQQRVAIARAMINKPDIILADEPTGNLDQETAKVIHDLIIDLAKHQQQTFLIVTHNPDLAALCLRTNIMEDGQLKNQ